MGNAFDRFIGTRTGVPEDWRSMRAGQEPAGVMRPSQVLSYDLLQKAQDPLVLRQDMALDPASRAFNVAMQDPSAAAKQAVLSTTKDVQAMPSGYAAWWKSLPRVGRGVMRMFSPVGVLENELLNRVLPYRIDDSATFTPGGA